MSLPHEIINPTGYVLGFAFSYTGHSVALIEKLKPDWQAGKLNGIGGKLEPGENPYSAMTREFHEETGVMVQRDDWFAFEVMRFQNGALVYCFTTRLPPDTEVQTMEEEKVESFPINGLTGGLLSEELNIIQNLQWLIPKAFHQLNEQPSERMIINI